MLAKLKACFLLLGTMTLLLGACGEAPGDDVDVDQASDDGGPDTAEETTDSEGLEPIRIGIAASLSGNFADAGTNLLRGYETWAHMVNAEGGVLGRPVTLITYDDASDSTTAVRAVQRLIDVDEVELVFGPYGSGTTFAVSQVTEAEGVPLLATAAGAKNIWEQGYEYVFSSQLGQDALAEPSLTVSSNLGLERVAVLYTDNDWGEGFYEASTEQAPELGVEIVSANSYPVDATDLSSAVLAARRDEAQVISSSAYLPDSVLIARALKDADWTPELVYLATARQVEFGEDLGVDAEGITSYAFWHPELDSPRNQEFQELYREKYHEDPSDHAAVGFSAGQVLQAAIESAGDVDRAAIRDALASVEADTVLAGAYRVDETGLQVGMEAMLVQWQEGELVIVGPDAYANHELITPLPDWASR